MNINIYYLNFIIIIFVINIYNKDDNDSFAFLSKDYNSISFSIRKDKLFKNSRSSTKNNECIAGVYIRIYKCEEGNIFLYLILES